MATVEIDGIVLHNVHEIEDCQHRACVLHNPTDHHMRGWPLHWRSDRAIFERICEHGIGHPDPDQFAYWDETGREGEGVHGCDSCCVPPPAPSDPVQTTTFTVYLDCGFCDQEIEMDVVAYGVQKRLRIPAGIGEQRAWFCPACTNVTLTGEMSVMAQEDF